MKNFLVFIYGNYYPSGGMNDLRSSFDSYPEAKAYLDGAMDRDSCVSGHVWDSSIDKIVLEMNK